MKVQFMSDLHLEFGCAMNEFQIPKTDADVIVLAGDVGLPTPKYFEWVLNQTDGTPTALVLGNHEHYNNEYHKTISDWRDAFYGSHFYVLENDSVDIDGVMFLGATLWTDYHFCGVEGEGIVK